MKSEKEPSQPDFDSRKALIARISDNTLVRQGNVTIRNVHPNNPYFPYFLYGENVETGESTSIRLDDDQLPILFEDDRTEKFKSQSPKNIEPSGTDRSSISATESRDDILNRNLREIVEATGNPFLGILAKLYTEKGMSSQLIKRFDEKKRGEIKELLPNEKEYEETRHKVHVFYQTRNFCDLPSESRVLALSDMNQLENIADEKERQVVAEKHPLFGLKPKQENT